MIEPRFFEDIVEHSSYSTGGRTITETDIVIHAGQTGDFYPHHMDAEWCSRQPFGQRIAHGTLVFAVAVGLTATRSNPAALSYGYDHLRFTKPVFIGDTISVEATITQKEANKRPGRGLVNQTLTVRNQHGEIVLVCDHLLLVEQGPML